QRGDQVLVRRRLLHEAVAPRRQHREQGARLRLARQGQHPHFGVRGGDLANGVHPAHPGHREVHHHHVGPEPPGQRHRLLPRRRFPRYLEPAILREKGSESVPDRGVVVHQQHAHRPGGRDGLVVHRSRGGRDRGPSHFPFAYGLRRRQREEEVAPLALPALDPDAPPVRLDDPLGDGEPQPCPTPPYLPRLPEAVEEPPEVLRRDPWPRV